MGWPPGTILLFPSVKRAIPFFIAQAWPLLPRWWWQHRQQRRRRPSRIVRPSNGLAHRHVPRSCFRHRLDRLEIDAANGEGGQCRLRHRCFHELHSREVIERLRPRGKRRPDADVTGPIQHRPPNLLRVVRANADDRLGSLRIRRASFTTRSSCPRCTPSDSTNRAMSSRSLTMNSTPRFRVSRRTSRAR